MECRCVRVITALFQAKKRKNKFRERENMYGVKITGVGTYVPDWVVTNEAISRILQERRADCIANLIVSPDDPRLEQFASDPDWIVRRTGIRERRFAAPDEATSDLAVKAAERALQMSGLRKDAVGFVIVATVTPDHHATPPTASLVQHKLGIPSRAPDGALHQLFVLDVSVACSSFVEALAVGYGFIASGLCKSGLVIGADVMERIIDWNNRAIFPLLGSGAGCFVLERTSAAEDEFLPNGFFPGSDGSLASLIETPKGGSRSPITAETVTNPFDQGHTLRMEGRSVFKEAVPLVAERIIPQALSRAGVELGSVGLICFHQANLRMIEPIVVKLRVAGFTGLIHNNIGRYGNTTSATIPLVYAEALEQELVPPGTLVLFVVFGGGFTWCTCLFHSEL